MPDEQKPKKRKWWGLRIGLAALILVLVLALAVLVVPLLLPEGWVGRIVAGRIEGSLNRAATVEGARFSLFSGFRARGITIERREGFGEGPLAKVGGLAADIDLGALLGGTVRLPRIELEGVEFHLVRDERGVLSIQDILDQPSSERVVEVGPIVATNTTLCVHDLGRGFQETVEVATVDVGARVDGKRALQAVASLGRGGRATVEGSVWTASGKEQFERAALTVKAHSLALGRLAADLAGKPLSVPELAEAVLDADLALGLGTERQGEADGTVTLRQLPAVAQLGFAGAERVLELKLDGTLSPDKQHLELTVVTRPTEAVRFTAKVEPLPDKESAPSFSPENYLLDTRLTVAADLGRGGLPGTSLAEGKGAVDLAVKGTLAELAATFVAKLADGKVRLADGKMADLPPLALEAEASGSLAELAVELKRFALQTQGLVVKATAGARPAEGAEARLGPGGELPKMAAKASLEADANFAQWPQSLRALVGMTAEGTLRGTLAARASLDATGDRVATKGTLVLRQAALQAEGYSVPPSDLDAAFDVAADLVGQTVEFRKTSISGEGIEGSLSGRLALGADAAPSSARGTLTAELSRLAQHYGFLLGVPKDTEVRGRLAWSVEAARQGDTVSAKGAATLADLFLGGKGWQGEPVIEPRAEVSHDLDWDLARKRLTVKDFHIATGSGRATLKASGTASAEALDLTASGKLSSTLLALAPGLPPELKVDGPASFALAVTGKPADVTVTGRLSAEAATVAFGTAFAKLEGVPARLDLAARVAEAIEVRQLDLALGGVRASAKLTVPRDLSRLDGQLRAARLDLAALGPLLPLFGVHDPKGHVDVDLAFAGPLKTPALKGRVVFDQCSLLPSSRFEERATVDGAVLASGSDLELSNVAVAFGPARVALEGSVKGLAAFPKATVALRATADALDVDRLLAIVRPPAEAAPGPAPPPPAPSQAAPLPQVPPELKGTLEATVGRLVYSKRVFEQVRAAARLADSVVELAELSVKSGEGTAKVTARVALGGDSRHAVTLDMNRLPLDQEFELLRKVPYVGELPFLNVVNALMGGKPETLSFLATAKSTLTAEGRDAARIRASLSGKGDVVLNDFRFQGSPLFTRLATLFRRPEYARKMLFERVDAPFTVANGRIESTATVPYRDGAFVVGGVALLQGQVDFRMRVRNPKGIHDIPDEVAAYLEAGNPVVYITGTGAAPTLRIPTREILDFAIKDRLKDKLFEKFLKPKDDEDKRDPDKEGKAGPQEQPKEQEPKKDDTKSVGDRLRDLLRGDDKGK